MTSTAAPSLTQNVVTYDAGANVTAVGWMKDVAALGLGDGGVLLAKDGETHRVEAHPGAGVLVAACDGARFVTGGDDGRVAVTGPDGATATLADPEGRLDRLPRGERVRRLRVRGRQAGVRPQRQGQGEIARGAVHGPRPRLRAQGLPSRDRPLQRRDALVPQPRSEARGARLEGFPSRRHLVAGRALRRDVHAGERPSRLAAPARPGAYADERLPVEDALLRVVARRQVARHLGRRSGDRLVLRIQGGSDGQGTAGMRG